MPYADPKKRYGLVSLWRFRRALEKTAKWRREHLRMVADLLEAAVCTAPKPGPAVHCINCGMRYPSAIQAVECCEVDA